MKKSTPFKKKPENEGFKLQPGMPNIHGIGGQISSTKPQPAMNSLKSINGQ